MSTCLEQKTHKVCSLMTKVLNEKIMERYFENSKIFGN